MADNVYTKVLKQAAELEGSSQALAARLRVPENTLVRWMSGRAQMPLQAFLNAMEFVAARNAEQAAPASDEKLSFKIGTVLARCASCEGTELRRADPTQALHYARNLACHS